MTCCSWTWLADTSEDSAQPSRAGRKQRLRLQRTTAAAPLHTETRRLRTYTAQMQVAENTQETPFSDLSAALQDGQDEAHVKSQAQSRPSAGADSSRFFEKVHRSYPLLDERSFRVQYNTEKASLSPVLLLCLYAHSLTYWRQSLPPGQHCPDVRFVWNQANEALYSDLYQSPGMPTVIAILLNISGRPLSSMIGNAVLHGAAISLAHCMGLNRSCLTWDISPTEKAQRTRLWWAIVIYDKWSSVAYGTPPQLRAAQHDVPLPSPETIMPDDGSPEGYMFDLWRDPGSSGEAISIEIANKLSRWEDSLPHGLRRTVIRGANLSIPGSANLRLSYLYVRLLGRKLGLESGNAGSGAAVGAAASMQRHVQARQAAEDIVIFVQELDDAALGDFWLSFNAFALSNTVGFLLRSALEAETLPEELAHSIYVKLASEMMTALESHRKHHGWDLANICIAQYSDVVRRLETSHGTSVEEMPVLQQSLEQTLQQPQSFDASGIDDMFPSLWDMFNGV
ncbi:uncharacterized protein PG998_011870 [Apiospora kogelbergensis]|uniref:uncharacterized protein n=1 Tax=Apiospora kogelbergensis TaxID=1337665 RepID=UPI00312EF6D6